MINIKLSLTDGTIFEISGSGTAPGAARITSNLTTGVDATEDTQSYFGACDAIESLILAHFCAGLDIESAAYIAGLETVLDALTNNL